MRTYLDEVQSLSLLCFCLQLMFVSVSDPAFNLSVARTTFIAMKAC